MKKAILILFAFFALFTAQAQDRTIFTSNSQEACMKSVDSLLQGAKRIYKHSETYVSDNRYIFEYIEADSSVSEPAKIKVIFQKRTKGANPALEQDGITVYELSAISGNYLDIFPIWEKYIDPAADIEILATRGYSDRKKFENADGSGEDYLFKGSNQNKALWTFSRGSWYKSSRL